MLRRALPLALAATIVLALAACSSEPRPAASRVSAADAAELLIDRNWIDTWPRTKDDRLHVYRFTPSMGGGVFQDRTLYFGTFELFLFEATGEQLRMVFPHTGQQVTTRYTIERVEGPAPFDLRLTLADSPRGPRVYYGIARETGDVAALDAHLARLTPRD